MKKHIPVGAGMGGGSANAAGVLLGLNRLYGAGLSMQRLSEIGLTLGADVPFCLLMGGAALACGIGERLTPLPSMPPVSYTHLDVYKRQEFERPAFAA